MQQDKKVKRKSVFFIVPAPLGISPGQRFRFEHYLPSLEKENINYRISSFYSKKGWRSLYKPGNRVSKMGAVLAGFFRRMRDLFLLWNYSHVFVYREATPLGPPMIEWVVAKVFRKKLVYDFDDAIWIPVSSEYNKLAKGLRNFGKTAKICKWSSLVTVGNDFLAAYAGAYNSSVKVIPTVVNTDSVHNKMQEQNVIAPAIGWTGTFSTLHYLDLVIPVLQELQKTIHFTFVVIADKDPKLELKNYRFVPWSKESEADDILSFHIGVMPLYDNDISRGKCGFKAIQYMSMGIPALVSPVGVNTILVDNGVDGFVCGDAGDWYNKMKILLEDAELRKKMGIDARKKIEKYYSVKATSAMFMKVFD